MMLNGNKFSDEFWMVTTLWNIYNHSQNTNSNFLIKKNKLVELLEQPTLHSFIKQTNLYNWILASCLIIVNWLGSWWLLSTLASCLVIVLFYLSSLFSLPIQLVSETKKAVHSNVVSTYTSGAMLYLPIQFGLRNIHVTYSSSSIFWVFPIELDSWNFAYAFLITFPRIQILPILIFTLPILNNTYTAGVRDQGCSSKQCCIYLSYFI